MNLLISAAVGLIVAFLYISWLNGNIAFFELTGPEIGITTGSLDPNAVRRIDDEGGGDILGLVPLPAWLFTGMWVALVSVGSAAVVWVVLESIRPSVRT